jgi:hypothetical protein
VIGVHLTDVPSLAAEIAAECARSCDWSVTQRWIALGRRACSREMQPHTVAHAAPPASKFALLNTQLADLSTETFRYVLVLDDDIELPVGFVDSYLGWVETCRFALAQPARTHDSSIDHVIVEQLDGLDARQTRFVEIGPCLSMTRAAVNQLIPFDEAAPMGWGLDFVWPLQLEAKGLTLGIVDATPVRHAFRRTVSLYEHGPTDRAMREYLLQRPHLTKSEAFVVQRSVATPHA